jgi:dTDP-4-amino-4,6-dideoxygalactose transaminase
LSKVRQWLGYFYHVPWCVPAWGWREFVITLHCILSGRVIWGPYEKRFENAIRRYLGVSYSISLNKGRSAIELALRALNIGDKDEVILPAYVCRSVLEAIQKAGAEPVFADIDETLHLTANTVKEVMNGRTKAVIVPHLFGNTAPIDEIEALLKGKGIYLIDDAAQSFGARRLSRFVGTFGDCGIVSCGPGKPLAGFQGGMLVTNNENLYRRAKSFALQNQTAKAVARGVISFWIWRRFRKYTLPINLLIQKIKSESPEPLYEMSRISNLDAGIGLMQIRSLKRNISKRRKNAYALLHRFGWIKDFAISDLSDAGAITKLVLSLNCQQLSVEKLKKCFGRHGIECQGGYSPLNKGIIANEIYLKQTEQLWGRVLCIPVDTRYKDACRNNNASRICITR